MKRFAYLSIAITLILLANPISKCINGNGIYVPEKGCLIEGRAICTSVNPDLNNNVTYGWANAIPSFAKDHAVRGEFNESNVTYTVKIDQSCRQKTDGEIVSSDLPKLVGKVFAKKGTFIHYGPGAFDWAYVTASGKVIAFLKPSEGGFLEYSVTKTDEHNVSIKQNSSRILILRK